MDTVQLMRARGASTLSTSIDVISKGEAWHVRVIGRDKRKIKFELLPGGATRQATEAIARELIAKHKADGWVDEFEELPADAQAAITQRVAKEDTLAQAKAKRAVLRQRKLRAKKGR